MVYKCKMCGGDLLLKNGSSLAQCEYCGSIQTVPDADNEKKITLFSRANRLRFNCEFDKAAGVYESIVAEFPEEAEAYWGLVLCKYGIEYVDDPATGKKVPTCHRSSFNSVMDDTDFDQTLENADPDAKKVYREEAKQIEELRKGIVEVSSKEDPYDIFICYKETDEKGERTLDSVLAQDLYDALTEKNYRVFFARITLEDKLGQEYEPYIFSALNYSKIMLVVGTAYEHFDAVWVKNEWSRYLKLMAEDRSKHLIPCFKGIDAYDMPKEFAKLQAVDLGKVGATQDILRGISKLIQAAAPEPTAPKGAELAPLLTLGSEALDNKEWAIASNRFDLALTVDPTCAEAYLGKLLAEFKCNRREKLAKISKRLNKSIQYKQLMSYADDTLKQELKGYSKRITARRIRRTLITVALIVSIIGGAIFGINYLETSYANTIAGYYDQTISAEEVHEELSKLSWYKEPNTCTKYLIEKELPGTYPEVKSETHLIIPDGVKVIREGMFSDCSGITDIVIADSVTAIEESAFSGCKSLTNINIGDNVTTIGKYAFLNCELLMDMYMGESVETIGEYAFSGCTNLSSVYLPSKITEIQTGTFFACKSMYEVVLPVNLITIGESAFANCSNLMYIVMPDSVETIGTKAFLNCENLNEVILGNGVTTISAYSFSGCKNLPMIEIPDSVVNMNRDAFIQCTKLSTIYFQSEAQKNKLAFAFSGIEMLVNKEK